MRAQPNVNFGFYSPSTFRFLSAPAIRLAPSAQPGASSTLRPSPPVFRDLKIIRRGRGSITIPLSKLGAFAEPESTQVRDLSFSYFKENLRQRSLG